MLIFKKGAEKTLLTFGTFGLLAKFYSVFQCKSIQLMVFLENHGIPDILIKSNLFKGLFYQSAEKDTFLSLSGHFLVTFFTF